MHNNLTKPSLPLNRLQRLLLVLMQALISGTSMEQPSTTEKLSLQALC